ncbi:MAG: hypothetical protein RLZZ165_1164, partial [Bacteroidota bacterium]
MKHVFLSFLALLPLCIFSHAVAQSSGVVSGIVLDEEGSPLPFANVLLYSVTNSALIKAGFSGEDGKFMLAPVPEGQYWLKTMFTGYKSDSSAAFFLGKGERHEHPAVKMVEVGASLQEVALTAERPLVSVKPDMLVFNVENTPNAIGENAFNLLRKAPGVMIDNNDNINLLGKSGLRIYVDGKQSPLSGKDLANFLKSIQSSQIESFEIITNPSSKYDAAGNAGIIVIRMRRDKSLGANATVDLGYAIGIYSKYNGSASANYRNRDVSVFGSYSYADAKNREFMDFSRYQDGLALSPINTEMVSLNFNHNFRAGADFFVGKKSTLGVLTSGFISKTIHDNVARTLIKPDTVAAPVSL